MTAALAPGLKHQILLTVEKHHTADAYGNPGVEVFATPALITLFENVCGECIRPFLSEDGFSVGTRVDIRHLGATPLGFEVSAQCEVMKWTAGVSYFVSKLMTELKKLEKEPMNDLSWTTLIFDRILTDLNQALNVIFRKLLLLGSPWRGIHRRKPHVWPR